MAAIRLNPKIVKCSVPVRFSGSVFSRINSMERPIGAMVVSVKVDMMTLLERFIWR